MANYRMRMAGSKAAEILIYDVIGRDFFGEGISAKRFAEDLKALGKVDTLNIRVNSPGGDVFDGLAIYNTLKRHPANKIIDIDGMALSIASVIVMAGDTVNMAGNAMMMIHDPWTCTCGSADDFRAHADLMDQVKGNLVSTYAGRVSIEDDEIAALMAAETWMTAEDAKRHGFVDAITEELEMAARFDDSRFKFKNAPRLERSEAPAANDVHRARGADMKRRVRLLTH